MRFQESLDIVRPLGHTRDIALALVGLAGVALLREDSARARSLLDEALSLLRPLGDRLREAEALATLGRVLRASGDAARALRAHAQSLQLASDAGALVSIAENLEGIGVLLGTERMSDPGRPEQAVRLLAAAAVLRLRAGAPRPAPDAARYERDVEAIRATIGDEALASTWHAGATAPSAEVVGEALRAVQRV